MRFVSSCVCMLVLLGCSTPLTPRAQLVRQIPAETVTNCRFLGPVSATEMFGLTSGHDAASALNKVRNEVAARGGNAFVLTNTTSSEAATNAQADAYDCP